MNSEVSGGGEPRNYVTFGTSNRKGGDDTPQQKGNRAGGVLLNIIGIVLCIIFIPVILINLALIVNTYTDSEHIPGIAGYSPVICLSGSMEDTFFTGDMIVIKDVDDPAALDEGEVICYLTGDGIAVTHRIVQVSEVDGVVRYITKGDANNTADQLAVSPDQIEGVYTGIRVPKLGSLAMFMQTTTGMLLFIVLPLLLIAGWYILRRGIDAKREKERTAELEQRLRELEQGEQPGQEQSQEDDRQEVVDSDLNKPN